MAADDREQTESPAPAPATEGGSSKAAYVGAAVAAGAVAVAAGGALWQSAPRKATGPATIRVNGKDHTVAASPDTPLLYVLRNEVGLTGPRFGCGLAQCGACTVQVNGEPVRACVTKVGSVEGKTVTTLEGLGNADRPHPLQKAFIDQQAVQCGYCISGMVMEAEAFLRTKPKPTSAEIKVALAGHLCRCGTHYRIVRAVQAAAGTL